MTELIGFYLRLRASAGIRELPRARRA